jgi:replicative DNA helicase
MLNVARQYTNLGVVLFSLEMPRRDVNLRLAVAHSRKDLHKARNGKLTPDDYVSVTKAFDAIRSMPYWIDETAGITLGTIRSRVQSVQADWNRHDATIQRAIAVVFVDYMQLMSGEGESRNEEVSKISRGLKQLAKDLRVSVVALSQLNREVEKRATSKRPTLADLRDSGSIEQDADCVMFVYRADYYSDDEKTGDAEIIIAKQRNGKDRRREQTTSTRRTTRESGDGAYALRRLDGGRVGRDRAEHASRDLGDDAAEGSAARARRVGIKRRLRPAA